jgi:recombination protein RecR
MRDYTPSFRRAIEELNKLPGIGPKSAEKLAYFLLRMNFEEFDEYVESLSNLRKKVHRCKICFGLTEQETCGICSDSTRDPRILCVIEEERDLIALEKTGVFPGYYHVLQGVLRPMEGIGSNKIRLKELFERIKQGSFEEVVIATNFSYEGELTAMYIAKELASYPIRVSRLASGLPMGSDIEFADQHTLRNAIKGREMFSVLEDIKK